MTTQWDDFAKKVKESQDSLPLAYEVDPEDFEEHYEEAYDLLFKTLEGVDFSKDSYSEDKNGNFIMSIMYKTYPGGRQIKRKNKQALFEQMVKLLNIAKDKPLKQEESMAGKLIDSASVILLQAELLIEKYLATLTPIFADILKQKKVHTRILQSLSTAIYYVTLNAPNEIVNIAGPLAKKCFEDEHFDFLYMMTNVADKCPDEIVKHISLIIELVEEGGNNAAHCPSIIQKIATSRPECLIKHLKQLIDKLNDNLYGVLYAMALGDVATKHGKEFGPFIDKIAESFSTGQPTYITYLGKIINGYYRDSKDEKKIKEIFDIYFARLKKDPEIYASSNLMSSFDLCKASPLHKKVLKDYYLKDIEALAKSNTVYVTTFAQSVVNYLNDITLENLDQRVDKQDEKIDEVKADVKSLDTRVTNLENVVAEHKQWVEKNLTELKNNMAKVGKVLPIPVNMTTKSNVIDTIHLHFICSAHKQDICIYPGNEEDQNTTHTFTTQTKEVNKWLKIGVQAVSLGFKIFNGDIYNGLANIKNMYDIYSDKREDKFETWTKEPFLTSSEQDQLILQLRKSTFYSEFSYEPSNGGWCCNACLGKQTIVVVPKDDGGKQVIDEFLDTTKDILSPAQFQQQQHKTDNETKVGLASEMAEQVKEIQESSGCQCTIL